jgi:hypothetical protein
MDNNNGTNNDNNIENFLEYSVENDEWLEILNNPKKLSTIVSWDSLFRYMVSEHEKYCAENCLCETCRSELVEYTEYVDEKISDMYWSCPNGC